MSSYGLWCIFVLHKKLRTKIKDIQSELTLYLTEMHISYQNGLCIMFTCKEWGTTRSNRYTVKRDIESEADGLMLINKECTQTHPVHTHSRTNTPQGKPQACFYENKSSCGIFIGVYACVCRQKCFLQHTPHWNLAYFWGLGQQPSPSDVTFSQEREALGGMHFVKIVLFNINYGNSL